MARRSFPHHAESNDPSPVQRHHRTYDPGLGSFVECHGAESVDASLLLLPLLGFLRIDNDRISRTIDTIERELMVDGLIHRRHPQHQNHEGAFLGCNCCSAECLNVSLRSRAISACRSGEYDVRAKRLAGNFPQALSPVALVRTALRFFAQITERGAADEDHSNSIARLCQRGATAAA